jgi:curved DNA-binding protein CbpA
LICLQILSNREKRREYDSYGHFGPNTQQTRREPFFDTHSGFSFFSNDGPSFHARTDFISNKAYESHIIPTSYEKPYIIEIISNWCLPCKCIVSVLIIYSTKYCNSKWSIVDA